MIDKYLPVRIRYSILSILRARADYILPVGWLP